MDAPQEFPLFVMSKNEANTVYIFRENGQEIRVRLSEGFPQDREALTDQEKEIIKNF